VSNAPERRLNQIPTYAICDGSTYDPGAISAVIAGLTETSRHPLSPYPEVPFGLSARQQSAAQSLHPSASPADDEVSWLLSSAARTNRDEPQLPGNDDVDASDHGVPLQKPEEKKRANPWIWSV